MCSRTGWLTYRCAPLASAVGSSPRVLLYLCGSKDGLIQALLARAREDELALLERLRRDRPGIDVPGAVAALWGWLSDQRRRELLVLWVEGYARSLVEPVGPWGGFAPPDPRGLAEPVRRLSAERAAPHEGGTCPAHRRSCVATRCSARSARHGRRARVSAAVHRQLTDDRLAI